MHTLPNLKYEFSSLEPYIDAQTMEIHYTKHHSGYVNNLNKALESYPDFLDLDIYQLLSKVDELPEEIRQTVINNAGGHANHSLFWEILTSVSDLAPKGDLLDAINNQFESFDNFKKIFNEKALSLFGSGWVFLIIDKDKKLQIKRHSFQNSPIMAGNIPILALDVWEHAYYLKYQNRRAEYVDAFWNVIDWDIVSSKYVSFSK